MEFRLGGSRLSRSMADYGSDSEKSSGKRIEQILDKMGIECDVYVDGGSGHGNDITVSIDGQDVIFENKSSSGSRVDYKQFRIRIDEDEGIEQATMTDSEVLCGIFDSIKNELDEELDVWNSEYPEGPSLTEAEAEHFWDEYKGDYTHSPSHDVHRCYITGQDLQDVLSSAGNDYIIIGEQVFSLYSGSSIEELCDYIDEAYVVLRVKYHSTDRYSYTLTLRAKVSDSGQDFDDQIFRIFDSV